MDNAIGDSFGNYFGAIESFFYKLGEQVAGNPSVGVTDITWGELFATGVAGFVLFIVFVIIAAMLS